MIRWFKKQYFNPDDPLEYHIFMIFFFECFLLSLVSGVLEGSVVAYGVGGMVLEWGFIIACIIMLAVPHQVRMMMQKPMLIFISFIYIPFLYLQSAGHDGTMLMFALLAVFMLSFVFRGKQIVVLICLNMLFYMAVVWAGYHISGLVIPYSDEESRIMDMITSVPMCFIALATMVIYVRKAYDNNNKRLIHLATKDELTGIYNRRSLSELLERKINDNRRGESGFVVMMLDIDFFKRVNDTYGHGFGDMVLQKFAETVQNALRRQDALARYGGEEFVAVLNSVEPASAIEIAERIRAAVSDISFGNELKITVSIGVSQSKPGDTAETLLARADTNLYTAKQNGRDQVIHDWPDM